MIQTHKNCCRSDCKQLNPQPVSNFNKRADRPGGLAYLCKSCSNVGLRKYRLKYPEKLAKKQRRDKLSKFYFKDLTGLEAEAKWKDMFEQQYGLCALPGCGNVATDTDHCHKTGKVRGLLCNPCNLLLGKIEKRPWFIENAVLYLKGNL